MRRDFHVHPELGFKEIRTGGIVAKELEFLGLEVTKGVGKTGVVGLMEGSKPGPTLLIRFDMDALPIIEETGTEYASQNKGVMHACGHDGHNGHRLRSPDFSDNHREDLAGTIKFCFQPSEEDFNDEECGGNETMIRDGVLEGPKVDQTLTLHLWNDKPLGWVGAAGGPIMAGAELFNDQTYWQGWTRCFTHLTIDPIVAGAEIVTALQTITSRNVAPCRLLL